MFYVLYPFVTYLLTLPRIGKVTVEFSLCFIQHHAMTFRCVQLHAVLTSGLHRGEWIAFTPRVSILST
jgi:hypothetical protein